MSLSQRLALSILPAGITVGMIFLLLSHLVGTKEGFIKADRTHKAFDFIRHQKDSELENRSRLRPKPPKEKMPPPAPKIPLAQTLPQPKLSAQNIKMPQLSLANQFKGDLLVGANVGSLSMDVIPLVRIPPIYPKRALRMKQEGSVTLVFTINPNGTVRNVKVKTSKPERIFDAAAVQAIKKWKFKPKLLGGKAVSQQGEQTIIFSLEGMQ